MKANDVIRSALHDAIGWQTGLADAYNSDPGNIERARALDRIKQYRAVLRKRYGSDFTMHDDSGGEMVSIYDIKPSPP